MEWIIPGTVLSIQREAVSTVEAKFRGMFLAGGVMLGQVSAITGLEPYAIQNWVKRGFLSSPERKRYTLNQLCRILNINALKNVLPMERICGLLSYINGELDDESDDIIDDSQLYFIFVRLAAQAAAVHDPQEWEKCIDSELSAYAEPVPGARERVGKVLRIMLTAWAAARLRQKAEDMLGDL